jgi:K+-sensing histidine kinase KdpD
MKKLKNSFRQFLQGTAAFLRDHPRLCFVLSLLLVLILGWLDHITRYEFGFLIFYFVPIVLAAWFSGLTMAILVALAATAAWFVADYNAYRYSSDFYRYWNLTIRLVTFLVNAFTTSGIRRNLEEYRQARLQQAALERRLEEATSLLPICRCCGGIRTDEAYREQVNRFVRSLSENDLQIGLCPDCAQRRSRDSQKGD